MRSTFRVLFYTKNQAIKNGRVPVMGRITVNGTTASFSCKRDVPLALWDAKGNCAKGKSEEARRLNRELENIKAQIGKHYQYLSDHKIRLQNSSISQWKALRHPIHSAARSAAPNPLNSEACTNCLILNPINRLMNPLHFLSLFSPERLSPFRRSCGISFPSPACSLTAGCP